MTNCIYRDLANKHVLITGGGSGIGAALTAAFLSQGALVSFIDVAPCNEFCEEMFKTFKQKPFSIKADITDITVLQQAIKSAKEQQGPIDVLINNAGSDQRHRLEDCTVEFWDNALDVNLRPHFFTAQAVFEDMKSLKYPSIINLSSNSFLLGLTGYPAYVSSKAGIQGLTKALAREMGPYNIRVNCLIPGWVMTQRQKEQWVTPESLRECLEQQCIAEAILPEDIADSCLFLASKSSRMITGQSIIVDAGRS